MVACSRLQALGLHVRWNLVFHFGGWRPGARRIHEGECAGVTNLVDQREGVAEIRLGFAGEADDEIGCEGEIRAARTKTRNHVEIILARMLAVHRRKDTVGTGLHRQVHVGHQLGQFAMGRDQIVIHVARVARRVTQTKNAGDLGKTAKQSAEA